MTTQLTVDFRAVAYAKYYYRNQFGEVVRTLPRVPTIHGGEWFNPNDLRAVTRESLAAYAKKIGILDRWTPVCVYQFRNSHSITFTGDKAKQKWKQYNEHIYSKRR